MLNEVLENIKSRRSVRTYTEQQVSAENLNLILEAATYAPSGMNYQTWHFTAIQDADILRELNEKIKGAFAKSDEPRLQERGHSETYCCYYHAPTLIIVSNEPTQWWASMDCACAMQNIFLAANIRTQAANGFKHINAGVVGLVGQFTGKHNMPI